MGNSSLCWAGFNVVVVALPKRTSMPLGCIFVRGRCVVVVVVVLVVVLLVSGAKPKPGCGAWLPPAPPAAAPPE